jgi:hypothetical protein
LSPAHLSPAQTARIEKLLENKDLNDSSRSFAKSLLESTKKWGRLSHKQWSAFERMEARFDPKVIAERQGWTDAWNEEKAKNLQRAAKYYLMNPPYFGEVAAKIIEDETYIPSEKLYRKMVENKYTQKVLATYASEPAYDAGSLVKVRSSQNCPHHRLKGSIALVVSNEGDISSAAKGGRPYTILPFGASKTFRIEERWLKKHKG